MILQIHCNTGNGLWLMCIHKCAVKVNSVTCKWYCLTHGVLQGDYQMSLHDLFLNRLLKELRNPNVGCTQFAWIDVQFSAFTRCRNEHHIVHVYALCIDY